MGANARWRRHVGPRLYGSVDVDIDPAQTDLITFGTGAAIAAIGGAHGAAAAFAQATGADQPTLNTADSDFKNKNSISIAGSQFLATTGAIAGGGATKGWMVLVIKTGASTATQVLVESSANMPANAGSWNTDLYEAAGQWRAYACGNPAGNYGAKAVNGIGVNEKHIMIATWDWNVASGAAMTMYLDSTSGSGSVISSGNSATTMGSYVLYVGQRFTGHVANFNGKLGRLITGRGDLDVPGIYQHVRTLYV